MRTLIILAIGVGAMNLHGSEPKRPLLVISRNQKISDHKIKCCLHASCNCLARSFKICSNFFESYTPCQIVALYAWGAGATCESCAKSLAPVLKTPEQEKFL